MFSIPPKLQPFPRRLSQIKKPAEFDSGGFLLFNFAGPLFAVAFASEGFFGAPLFTRFQVKRVTLYFFNDVFLLYFTFKSSERTFQRLAILQMDFCQLKFTYLTYRNKF
jgi:hypothetical protein